MLNIKEQYEIEITDLSTKGEGIGRVEGIAVFVPATIPGDLALIEITDVKKNYGKGKVINILSPSNYRVESTCSYESCGGCSLQNMSYEGQLWLKKKWVIDRLTRIGGIDNPFVHDVIPMEEPFRYRNKAEYALGRISGKAKKERGCDIGFYQAGTTRVVNINSCLLQTEVADRIADVIRRYVKESKTPIYGPKSKTGVLRHVVVKTAFNTGEIMVILVATEKSLQNIEWLVDEICIELEDCKDFQLESVILNVNKSKTGKTLGDINITLAGNPTIKDHLMGLDFEISPTSFYQVNPIQTVKLYEKVKEYASLNDKETVLDVYCGVGTIGLILADKAKKVLGIESVKNAFLDANRNATINGIVNAEYINGKAEEELPKLVKKGLKADLIILDPPRSGCEPELLEAVAMTNAPKIIYVSCDPATLARDIKLLTDKGYKYIEAQPVDMFPHTSHVECVTLMSRVKE
ncbi:MAG: 23S rRNA (uracil(1939)-C(5))-methyltransferase RlmD [Clostridiales bacterium]|nr:23S rRNA (uracil(1939)-C(5))-methyltransferase RlmD [Clostridiales bacterium]